MTQTKNFHRLKKKPSKLLGFVTSPGVGQNAAFFKAHSCIGPVLFQALTLSINGASCVAGMGTSGSIFDNASMKTENQAQIGHSFGWIDLNKMDGYGI